ncbi:MAG: hypothetical protein Q8O05_07960 [Chloroflexota bacterium]|nr:hypothetical protein [Chloroflexota bacterium]
MTTTNEEAKVFTKQEIQAQIEALKELGSTVSFYLAGSSASGGPFGRGAVIIEVNPNLLGKKQKKYNTYIVNVDGTQLQPKGEVFFGSDKPKDLASWVKDRHYKPTGR